MNNIDNDDLAIEEKQTVLGIFQKSLKYWWVVVTIAIGLGVFKIEAIKVDIPPEYFPFIGYGVIALLVLCLVFFLTSKIKDLSAIVRRYQSEMERVESDFERLKNEEARYKNRSFPSFMIEDIALSSLVVHVEKRKDESYKNPVKLDLFEIDCSVVGTGERKDAKVKYTLKGTNISKDVLTGLYLSIAADNLVPLEKLDVKVHDLTEDPSRESFHKAKLKGPDSIRKDLFLPFTAPGINPNCKFEIEMTYLWPGIFASTKDYWFLDNIDFEESTNQVSMKLQFVDMEPETVNLYSFDMNSGIPTHLGAISPDSSGQKVYGFNKDNPSRDTYYILVFEGA